MKLCAEKSTQKQQKSAWIKTGKPLKNRFVALKKKVGDKMQAMLLLFLYLKFFLGQKESKGCCFYHLPTHPVQK